MNGHYNHYSATFPFVTSDTNPALIKPIYFRHTQSKQLIDHGLHWLSTMNQLIRSQLVSTEKSLFTYEPPKQEEGILADAFRDIKQQIEAKGIKMTDIKDINTIHDFAKYA
ncbi:MAG: hypothetical protein KAH22_06260 [Thiotrichaceae bacterium]|nr:hypothetical protein [Thiotrichaceae bacterium]